MSEKISPRNRLVRQMVRMTWYYDSHVHLSDMSYTNDLDYIILGMEKIKLKACCVSMNNDDSQRTLTMAKSSSLVLPFIGIHPECANDDLETMTDMIHKNYIKWQRYFENIT